MVFADHFPTVLWVGRRVASTRPRRIGLYFALALGIVTIALRISAGIFESRVLAIVNGLAQVRLEQTTKAELLKTLPGLDRGAFSWDKCSADECYSKEISIWPMNQAYFFIVPKIFQIRYLSELAFWFGFRFARFTAAVEIKGGKVHNLEYTLGVVNAGSESPEVPFLLIQSVRWYQHSFLPEIEDESPDYRVTESSNSASGMSVIGLDVVFTPGASAELVRHAFDLHLNCIWQLRGCTSERELLPRAWDDKVAIESAGLARLQSSGPCPDRILPRRARDSSYVLLVKVERIPPQVTTQDTQRGQIADYQLLEVLKGKAARPLKAVGHSPTIRLSRSDITVPNPAVELLHPGTRVLMFSSEYSTDVDTPCQIVAATPSALATIRAALASPSSHVAGSGW